MPERKSSVFGRIHNFLTRPLQEKLNRLEMAFYRVKGALYYRFIFGSFGRGSVICQPLLISNPQFIHIGNNVLIRKGARLEAILSDRSSPPELRIGDDVNIEQNVHIVCHSRVVIGKQVSITGNCAIVDVTHPYEDVHDPTKIGDRILLERSFVEIGERSFLGFNVIILPNIRIGRNCVIGAHSLVSKDVSDYSVAAGNPARTVRRYDFGNGEWISTT
jgi:acetyltransferase-like isoleucine patch superfamily enzyme